MNPNSAKAHAKSRIGPARLRETAGSIPEFEMVLRLKPELTDAAEHLRRAQAQSWT